MEKKGKMRMGINTLPYSRKAMKILADSLEVDESRLWLDPVTNRISIKQFTHEDKKYLNEDWEK